MSLETIPSIEQNSFKQYQKMGGIINKIDYARALAQAKDIKSIDKQSPEYRNQIQQAMNEAKLAGISLNGQSQTELDPRVALYVVLGISRLATNSNLNVRNPLGELGDKGLFAEVLRMLGDTESLNKFTAAPPNIFREGK